MTPVSNMMRAPPSHVQMVNYKNLINFRLRLTNKQRNMPKFILLKLSLKNNKNDDEDQIEKYHFSVLSGVWRAGGPAGNVQTALR